MERHITWKEIKERVKELNLDPTLKYYGVPRGGQYISALLNPVDTVEEADVIIDDLIESGATKKRYKNKYPNKDFIALYVKKSNDNWLVFPWELKDEPVEDNILRICQYYKIKEAKNIQDLILNYENR